MARVKKYNKKVSRSILPLIGLLLITQIEIVSASCVGQQSRLKLGGKSGGARCRELVDGFPLLVVWSAEIICAVFSIIFICYGIYKYFKITRNKDILDSELAQQRKKNIKSSLKKIGIVVMLYIVFGMFFKGILIDLLYNNMY